MRYLVLKMHKGCMINLGSNYSGVILMQQLRQYMNVQELFPNNSIDLVLEDPSVAPDVMYALTLPIPMTLVLEPNFSNFCSGEPLHWPLAHANGCVLTFRF